MRMRLLCVRCVTGALPTTRPRGYLRVQGVANISEFVQQVSHLVTVDKAAATWEPNTGNNARARASVSGIIHSSCDNAPRCFRVCIPSYLSLSLSLSLSLVSCNFPQGSLKCVHARRGPGTPGSSSTHRLALHEAATEGNFSESESTARSKTLMYISLLHLLEYRQEIWNRLRESRIL